MVSYPYGADIPRVKVMAAEQAVAAGADELEVVMNIPAMLSGDFRFVRDELSRGWSQPVRIRASMPGRGTWFW